MRRWPESVQPSLNFDGPAPALIAAPIALEPLGKTEYKISDFSKPVDLASETPRRRALEIAKTLRKSTRPASDELIEWYDSVAENRPYCAPSVAPEPVAPPVDDGRARLSLLRDGAWYQLADDRAAGRDDAESLRDLARFQMAITSIGFGPKPTRGGQ